MDIVDRVNKRKSQKGNSASTTVAPAPPISMPRSSVQAIREATQQEMNNAGTMDKMNPESVSLRPKEELKKQGADWRALDYDTAIRLNPQLSRSQYISGASQYRKENNQEPFSDAELYTLLGGKNPFVSAEAEQKRDRAFRRAEYVDSIGNVLANLVNYVRATNGNPAMNLTPLSANRTRIDRLRAYHDALDRSDYNAYMQMLSKQKALEAAKENAEREFRQAVYLQNMKQNTPLAQAQAAAAAEKVETERAKREGVIADTEYKKLQAAGQAQKNKFAPSRNAAELKLMAARTNAANQGKSSKKNMQPYKVRLKIGNGYSDEYDLSNDEDVLRMYWEGAKFGKYPEYKEIDESGNYTRLDLNKLDPDKIRNMILYNRQYYITPDDKDYGKYDKYKSNNKPRLGWGTSSQNNNSNNNDLDW